MKLEAILKGGANITGRYKNFVRTTEGKVNRLYEMVDGQPILRRAAKIQKNTQNWAIGATSTKCYEIQTVKTYPANEKGFATEVRQSNYFSKSNDKFIDSSKTIFEVPAEHIPVGKDFCIGGIKKPGVLCTYEGPAYESKDSTLRVKTVDRLSNSKIWENLLTNYFKAVKNIK